MKPDYKHLGEVGSEAATKAMHLCCMTVDQKHSCWKNDEPAREAFARAVIEEDRRLRGAEVGEGMPSFKDCHMAWIATPPCSNAIASVRDLMLAAFAQQLESLKRALEGERECSASRMQRINELEAIIEKAIEMVNASGTTAETLPKAINAKIMQRDEYHGATIRALDGAKAEIQRIKTEYASLLQVYNKTSEDEIDARKALREAKADFAQAVVAVQADKHEALAKLAAAEKRLGELEWRPVSVKPDICQPVLGFSPDWIDPDFNRNGIRECFLTDEGPWHSARWDNDQDCWKVETKTKPILWLDLASLRPAAPTAEELSREEFEKACAQFDVSFTRDGSGNYGDSRTRVLFEVWMLARASKEGKV